MKNLQLVGTNRLKNVLALDKSQNPNKIVGILKSEILNVLKNYMDISTENLDFEIAVNDKGGYTLKLIADVRHLHIANYLF